MHVRGRRRIFLHCSAKLVERALVFRVFRRNTRGYRLRAFELRARVEEPALFATVQFKIALRTFPVRIESGRQHRAAIRAARARHGADHPRRARSKMIGSSARAALRRPAISVFFLVSFLFFRFSIAAVAVLAIHKRLRPPVTTDCHCCFLYNWVISTRFPDIIQSECFTRPAHQTSPMKLSWNAAEQKMGHLCL